MTTTEQLVEEIWDAYFKGMSAEQTSFFDVWVREETEAGRFPRDPDAVTLRAIITSWLGGWQSSHMCLVQTVHDL